MDKKSFYYIIALVFLSIFTAIMAPSAVLADETNVVDWVEDKQPAEDQEKESAELNAVEDKSLTGTIAKLIFYLLLILGMIYGLIKFLALKQQKMQPNQAVKLMGGTPLGNNKSLQLVKVGEKVYLLGVGDQVTLIKEFSGTDEIGAIEQDLEQQSVQFSNPLAKLPFLKKGGPEADAAPSFKFDQLFSQSLNKQKLKQQQLKQELAKNTDEKEGSSLK